MNELLPNFEFLAFLIAGCSLGIGLILCTSQKSYRAQLIFLHGTLDKERASRKQIEADFQALLSCSKNMGRKLREHAPVKEIEIKPVLDYRVETSEITAGDKVHELVERGLSVEEVASVCGLTRGEVDFLSRFFDAGNREHAVH